MRAWLVPLAAVMLVLGLAGRPAAQEAPAAVGDAVTVPWAPLPGVYEQAGNRLTGFFAELSREIAQRAGLTLDFRRYDNFPEALEAQARGETDMLAGVARLPLLEAGNLFSQPFAGTAIYLFVRDEEPPGTGPETMAGRPVGAIRNTAGSDLAALGGDSPVILYDSLPGAFGALLLGEVDGVVALHKAGADFLQRSRLDYRIRIAGAPLRTERHVVALARDHAELLPAVDDALAAMQADGTLTALLTAWNMIPPAPPPEVLTVGVAEFAPYQVIRPDGTMTGYGVETLRALARRAGLTLEFRQISSEDWAAGPGAARYDLLPPISVTPGKRAAMDFTIPVQRSSYSIFVPHGEGARVAGLDDLVGRRVGVVSRNLARQEAEQRGDLDLVLLDSARDLIDALLSGSVDAILYPTVTVRHRLEQLGRLDEVDEVAPPFLTTDRAVALRHGLAEVRERLNAVIPGYLSSEEYQSLRDRWLGPPEFWTPERILIAELLAATLAIATVAGFVLQSRRAERRALAQAADMKRLSDRLGAILDTTRSAIIGLARDGSISIANPGAARMLCLASQDWPVPWPGTVRFVDAEDGHPLDASADPIHRAMAGATLVSERAILRRGADSPARVVRVSSAQVEASGQGDVATVLVMEDVTEQERNRQQAERSRRLDALGQLTGGVAHDFNNILGTIAYATELAAMSADAPQKKFLDTALASVRRGDRLTSRLLTFARRQPGSVRPVLVSEVLSELQDLAGPVLERTVALHVGAPEAGLRVLCDPSQLENALLNLVLNSRDALLGQRGTGNIVVQAGRAAESDPQGHPRVEISVTDDGPGMTPEVRQRATDPFFTTKGESGGTGLGLSMVYGFAEQSDGELLIDTASGAGTSVRILLPEGELPDEEEVAAEPGPSPGSGETILVVEDETDLLAMTSEIIRTLGYEVITAPSGRAALERIERGALSFDLLLTDIVMPGGVGGFELARRLRDLRPGIPVIYMSGYAGITRESMGSVPAPTLRKPCSPADLSRALRRQLEEA